MNKEEMEKIVNDIKDSLWYLENNKCNIDTKENGWETYYGLNDELIRYIRKIEQENKQLQKQLDYLRSGEYYNQLRFERDMLQDIVDNGEISKEDREFIDCTHRNTELLEENKQLKDKWNKLKKELKDKFEEFRYVEDECLRTMAQEDDSILFSMSCIERGDSNE